MDPPTPHSIKKLNNMVLTPRSNPHSRISCTLTIPILTLDATKHEALIKACVMICIIHIPYTPNETARNITARCTEVLNAIIFFPSNHDGKKSDMSITVVSPIVILPLRVIASTTPATTIVDECNRDDTGVGPSIAIGNQYLRIQIADLPRIAIKPRTQLSSDQHNIKIPKSLTRLYITADMDAPEASLRFQKEINKKDIRPIYSHLKASKAIHLPR